MAQARTYVLDLAHEANELLGALADGPVREALSAFTAVIATRTA